MHQSSLLFKKAFSGIAATEMFGEFNAIAASVFL